MRNTTKDAAGEVRAILKAAGITSRQVSVRAEYFSMGSALRLTVKDPAISVQYVRRIAERQEDIRRCSYTGEILSGGNRYVTVARDWTTRDAFAAPYLAAITATAEALATLPAWHGVPVTIAADVLLFRISDRDHYRLSFPSRSPIDGSLRELAASLGEYLTDSEHASA